MPEQEPTTPAIPAVTPTPVTPVVTPAPAVTPTPTLDIKPPEKFQNEDGSTNVDGLLKSYSEAEKTMSKQAAEIAALTAKAPSPADPGKGARTPEDLTALMDKHLTEGRLAEGSAEAIGKELGLPAHYVEQYQAGNDALTELQTTRMFAELGGTSLTDSVAKGREVWNGLATWAQANVPADELTAFNAAVGGNDPNTANLAVQGMMARYKAGGAPQLQHGDGKTAPVGNGAFASREDWLKAIRDPRYKTDGNYARQVDTRATASQAQGIFTL